MSIQPWLSFREAARRGGWGRRSASVGNRDSDFGIQSGRDVDRTGDVNCQRLKRPLRKWLPV